MQQLMALLLAQLLQNIQHRRVALCTLEGGRPVHLVQTVGTALLPGEQGVGLARAAHTAALTGHDLDQVVVRPALVDLLQQLDRKSVV